jgi:hypothetical protein
VNIVGLIKYPLLRPLGNSGPPAANVAPSEIPLSIKLIILSY